MDGTTDVPTVNAYVFINKLKVIDWGGSPVNAGVITATADTDVTVSAQIATGIGKDRSAIYAVPSIETAFLADYFVSTMRSGNSGASAEVFMAVNERPDVELTGFITEHSKEAQRDANAAPVHDYEVQPRFPGPCIIKARVNVVENNASVSAGFSLLIVDNTLLP